MRKFAAAFLLLMFCSCREFLDKPKNLISKDEMAEIIADLAINSQIGIAKADADLEAGTLYIVKQHKIDPQAYIDSYQYYIYKKEMSGIYEAAQDIIKNKDPEAAAYIEKEEKKNTAPVLTP